MSIENHLGFQRLKRVAKYQTFQSTRSVNAFRTYMHYYLLLSEPISLRFMNIKRQHWILVFLLFLSFLFTRENSPLNSLVRHFYNRTRLGYDRFCLRNVEVILQLSIGIRFLQNLRLNRNLERSTNIMLFVQHHNAIGTYFQTLAALYYVGYNQISIASIADSPKKC